MKNRRTDIHHGITIALPHHIRMSLRRNIRLFVVAAMFMGTMAASFANPEMRWVLLPGGTSGSCTSNTDACANIYCYGLEYTPENTGVLTSYTTAFFTECVANGSPVLSNTSCVMTNQSAVINGCASFNLIQIQCSGNTGSLTVTTGVPVIIHQVCFTVPVGVTLNVVEDTVTDLTTSIDLNGGGFVTEYPDYEAYTLINIQIVTNTDDIGAGSFRDVVACAPDGSTITFSSSLLNQTINLTSGVIDINKDLTIQGLGMNDLTLSGNNSSVILHQLPGYTLTLKDIALKNADAPTNGGAIFAEGNVRLQNVLLQNNFENGVAKSMTVTNTSYVEIMGQVFLRI